MRRLLETFEFEHSPTHLPRPDITALPDRVCLADEADLGLHDALMTLSGVKKWDPSHIVNARAERCPFLVTCDIRMRRKVAEIARFAGVQVTSPEALLVRL